MMWSQEALRARYEEVRETRPNYPPVLYECQVNSEITEFTKFTEFTEITSSTNLDISKKSDLSLICSVEI